MTDTNHVILIGRLTRDAELKYTSGGSAVTKFAIAVNRSKKSGDGYVEEASFFDIVLWGRLGETLSQYLVKGKQVAVDGELHQNRWEQDGQNRSKVEIMADNVQLLGGGTSESGRSATQTAPDAKVHQTTPEPATAPQPRQSPDLFNNDARPYNPADGDIPPDFPDDIPF